MEDAVAIIYELDKGQVKYVEQSSFESFDISAL